MVKKVVIFAGHDDDIWETLGAKGVRTDLEKDGVYEEYDTNILIAAGAVEILRKVPGITVYFPQEKGRDMTLAERVAYANSMGADLLIDIHSNASASRTATGAAAFYWNSSANGKKAADIYARLLKEANLPTWQNGTFASNLTDGWSGFYMLRYPKMPAILLENFFFTTRSDLEKYLLNPSVQKKLMAIVAETAVRYFGLPYIEGKEVVQVSNNIRDYYMLGDNLPGVGILQSKLNKVGHKLTVDSIYGKGTESAVTAFQRTSGLVADGIAGKATLAKLDVIIANLNKPSTVKPKAPVPSTDKPSDWAKATIDAAVKAGISDGTRLHDPVTREEAIVLAMRAAELAPRLK